MDRKYFESFDSHIIFNKVKTCSVKFKGVDITPVSENVLFISDESYARQIESVLDRMFGLSEDDQNGLFSNKNGYIIVLPSWIKVNIQYKDEYSTEEGIIKINESAEFGYTSEPEC